MLVETITSTTATQNVKDNGLKTFNIEDELFVLIRAIDLESKNDQLKSFSQTINFLNDDVEKKDNLLKLQSDKIRTLSATIASLKSHLEEKDESILAYEQKLQEVETQIVKEREDYETAISNMKSYFTFLQNNKIETLSAKISSLKSQLEEKDESIVQYEQTLQQVETQIAKEREDYEATISSSKLEYETLNKKFKVLQTKFKNVNTKNSVNEKLLKQLQEEHKKCKTPSFNIPSTPSKNKIPIKPLHKTSIGSKTCYDVYEVPDGLPVNEFINLISETNNRPSPSLNNTSHYIKITKKHTWLHVGDIIDINGMSAIDLKYVARNLGIANMSSASKDQLIEKIIEYK